MKFLIVVALVVGAHASRPQTQTQGGNDEIPKIFVRFDENSGFGGNDPVYPPLTPQAPQPSGGQTFRLVPAGDGQTGGYGGQPSGHYSPPAPAPVTHTQVLKLRRVGGGSTGGGYAGGASSGYTAPQVQQAQTYTLRKVEQESAGFGGQTGGFSAPIPAPQVTSFTLRKVEGGATTGGSYQGQSSYASQRSDYGGASSYASQSGFNQPAPSPQVTSFTLRKVEGGSAHGSTGGSFQGQSGYANQRSGYAGASGYAGESSSKPFGSEYLDQVFKLINQ